MFGSKLLVPARSSLPSSSPLVSPTVPAQKLSPDRDSRVQIGLEAAPVHLNLKGKNIALVGLGSYFVNVASDCNGCHSAGPPTGIRSRRQPLL